MPIFEVIPMQEEIQELILEEKSALAIREKAKKLGMLTLQDQGFQKVIAGVTDLDEWVRVVA